MKRIITLRVDEQEFTVTAYRKENSIIVERDGVPHTIQVLAVRSGYGPEAAPGEKRVAAPGTVRPSPAESSPTPMAPMQPVQPGTADRDESVGKGVATALAPMAGVVKEILVAPGDKVTEGQQVLVMEAMKMDVFVNAPVTGTVKTVLATVGAAVTGGHVLLTIESGGV